MPERLQIQLDPLNPGQFFACCGLLELLNLEEPGLLSSFESDPKRPRTAIFNIQRTDNEKVISAVLNRLQSAEVTFPKDDPDTALRPATICYGETQLELDWWRDHFREKTTNIKCWAGQVTTERLFKELLPLLEAESTGTNLFQRAASTTSLFGVDPRSAWNTLDLGFSPNEHGVASTVFPAVEVLGAIGLQLFRPESGNRNSVRYSLWEEPLPATVARLAFLHPWDGLPVRNFSFEIARRGQSYKYFSFATSAEKESSSR